MRKAFTLIELLVTIGIIVLMTGVGVARFRYTDRTQQLENAAVAIKQILARARAYSLSIPSGLEKKGIIGWGVYFTSGVPASNSKIKLAYFKAASSGAPDIQNPTLYSQETLPDEITIAYGTPISRVGGEDAVGPFIFGSAKQGKLIYPVSGQTSVTIKHLKIVSGSGKEFRTIEINPLTGLTGD